MCIQFIRFRNTRRDDERELRHAFEQGSSLRKLLILRGNLALGILTFTLSGSDGWWTTTFTRVDA